MCPRAAAGAERDAPSLGERGSFFFFVLFVVKMKLLTFVSFLGVEVVAYTSELFRWF